MVCLPKLKKNSYSREGRITHNTLNKKKLYIEMIFSRAKAMFPTMKDYCFTKTSDDVKWKDNLLKAARIMNDERLSGHLSVGKKKLSPAKYYETIRKDYVAMRNKKKNILMTDHLSRFLKKVNAASYVDLACDVVNSNGKEKPKVNPNSNVNLLSDDVTDNNSVSMASCQENINARCTRNSRPISINLSSSIAPNGVHAIQAPSNVGNQVLSRKFFFH